MQTRDDTCPRRPPPAHSAPSRGPQQCGAFRIHQPLPRRRHIGGWLPFYPRVSGTRPLTGPVSIWSARSRAFFSTSIDSDFATKNFQKILRTTMSNVFFRSDHFPHVFIAIRAVLLPIFAPQKNCAFFPPFSRFLNALPRIQ